MASLQRFTSHGRTYWRLVESYRRADGRPAIRTLAHLGRPDDLLARLQTADPVRVRSVSCGAVDTLWHLAQEFGLPAQIDAAVAGADGRSQAVGFQGSLRTLIHRLATVRRATLVAVRTRAGRPRVTEQLEDGDTAAAQLAAALHVGPAPPPRVADTRRRR